MDATTAAVEWWADKLRRCKQSGLTDDERRDPANAGYQFAEVLMMMAKPKVSDGQIEQFKSALSEELSQLSLRGWWVLDVDYQPCAALSNALFAASIDSDMGTLPIKTTMWMRDGKVDVRYGCGAPLETIYPKEPL